MSLLYRLKFVHGSAEKHYQGNRDLESLAAFVEEMLDYGSKQEVMPCFSTFLQSHV